MIISRTPLRMSFAGGGSDLPSYYREFGGAVLSTAINQYVYVNVNKKFDEGIRIGYSKNEEVSVVEQIQHPLVRHALEYLQIPGGVEITTIADIPSSGTGLGSSSSFTVGLLHAIAALRGQMVSKEMLAKNAIHIEQKVIQEHVGSQDQISAAFGGFNRIDFKAHDDSFHVSPLIIDKSRLLDLQSHLHQCHISRRVPPAFLNAAIRARQACGL